MTPSRNNKGIAHENGAIERPHGHLKRAIEDALRLRGHLDFEELAAYRRFIDQIVGRINARNAKRIDIERACLANGRRGAARTGMSSITAMSFIPCARNPLSAFALQAPAGQCMALMGLVYRDQLFARRALRDMFDRPLERGDERQACRTIVALLALAHECGCETGLQPPSSSLKQPEPLQGPF